MKHPTLPLRDLFQSLDWSDTKFHIAQRNIGGEQPLDDFSRDFDRWRDNWTGNYHSKRVWNRTYVFTLIEVPRRKDRWLFGGVFEVVDCKPGKHKVSKQQGWNYKVKDTPFGQSLIGRLVVNWPKDQRSKHRIPLNQGLLDSMVVAEITPEPYIGEDFPGHGAIDHSFATLESLWKEDKPDWKVALENCHGVYLITDTKAEKRYVGSACGDTGIWSRWQTYFNTEGHGGNKRLREHLKGRGKNVEYVRQHFRFCLLERSSSRDSRDEINARENYWKEVLLTRGKDGLNDN